MAKPVKKPTAAVKKGAKPAAKSKPAPKASAKASHKAPVKKLPAKSAAKAAKPASKAVKPVGKPVPKANKPAPKTVKPVPKAVLPVTKSTGVLSKLVQAVIGAGKKTVAKVTAKTLANSTTTRKAALMPVSKAPVSVAKQATPKVAAGVKSVPAKSIPAKVVPAVLPAADAKAAAKRTAPVAKAYAVAKAVVAVAAPQPTKRPATFTSTRKQEHTAVRVDVPKGYKPSSKEPYMGPLQQAYFRQKLSNWRVELVEESKQTMDNLRDEVRDVGDEAERATRETENSLELRTRDRYRKLISKIDEALRRIDEGSYGFCVDTGDEIGLDRLGARPTAERTVDAQERWEHRQRQMGE